MNDFKTIEDYESHISGLSLRELKSIAHAIDKNKYPDRYKLLCKLIKEKNSQFKPYKYTKQPTKEYPSGVLSIRNIHIGLIAFLIVILPIGILLKSKSFDTIGIIQALAGGLISLLVIIGINQRKEWVVTLVMITSYLGLVSSFVFSLSKKLAGTVTAAQLIGNLLAMVFACYQIYVFSNGKTKEYFRDTGQTII